MRFGFRPISTLVLVIAVTAVFAAVSPDSLSAGVDRILSPLASATTPGVAVLVRSNGKAVLSRTYGVRDLRTLTPIDEMTNFRLASFSKQFTAMAVMLLVHDGKLRYEDTLPELFPGFPEYGRAITVRHLLTHTSGLPHYEDVMEKMKKDGRPVWTSEHQIQDTEVLDILKRQRELNFTPGTRWVYSNSAYVLLGLVVAKASGVPFDEFLRQRIFAPLHMDRTLAFVRGKNTVSNRAYGHVKRDGAFVEADQSSTSATLGDGGIYSNLVDLAKWDEALTRHTLLSETEMKPALTAVRLADGSATHWPLGDDGDNLDPGKPVSYGFGWFLDPYKNQPRMWHTGSTSGFRTVIERFTTKGTTIIILCNRTDLEPAKLALQITDLAE